MTVVDVHIHLYPQKIAQRASDAIGQFYETPMYGDGDVPQLLEGCKSIDYKVVHSVATTAAQVTSINNFIAQTCAEQNAADIAAGAPAKFIGFATMQQDFIEQGGAAGVAAELDRAQAAGLVGVKLHHDFQKCNADDPRFMELYALMEQRDIPLLVHAGDFRYDYTHPRRIANILHEFGRLRVDAAHMGGWHIPEDAIRYLAHERCWVDVSSTLGFIGDKATRDLIEIFGTDRVLFGSDYPMWKPDAELERFYGLGFSKADYERMCHRNAEEWLQRDFT